MQIFNSERDYKRFKDTMLYYQLDDPKPKFSAFSPETFNLNRSQRIIEIISYCFMPNHFHFLLKQLRDGGISEFVSKLSNSYTKYFNTKNERVGSLLQGAFKAVHVDDDSQLLHLTRYIHLNPIIGYVVNNINDHKWSSYHEFV